MIGYLVSLIMGLAVGVAYGLVHVRSPAPPVIALIGLLGMVLGEQAIDLAKRHVSLFPGGSIEQPPGDPRAPLARSQNSARPEFTPPRWPSARPWRAPSDG